MKRNRQRAILELVRRVPLSSQYEIKQELARAGHDATQSTISRDLEELGLVRSRDPEGRLRYSLPTEASAAAVKGRLRALLSEFVISIEASGNLIVAVTPPGAANAVAEALDHAAVDGILGTVAGDNTILVIAREGVKGRTIADRLKQLGGLS